MNCLHGGLGPSIEEPTASRASALGRALAGPAPVSGVSRLELGSCAVEGLPAPALQHSREVSPLLWGEVQPGGEPHGAAESRRQRAVRSRWVIATYLFIFVLLSGMAPIDLSFDRSCLVIMFMNRVLYLCIICTIFTCHSWLNTLHL